VPLASAAGPVIDPVWRGVKELLGPASLEEPTETARPHHHRLVICVVTLVVGSALLGVSLQSPPGSTEFYVTAAILAVVWLVGGRLAGPQPLGGRSGRQIALPILLGVLAFAVFAVGALIVMGIDPLHDAVNDVVKRADTGSRALVVAITVVNGIAEEVFFRGAFYRLLNPRTAALWTTVCYVIVTAAAGNLMLVLAAAVMGTLWALERRATGGILASSLTHITWSVLTIFLLPR
jgi:membrane protease YdiL (CAAX protease family)